IARSVPGATNLVTGIATAYLDSVPMVAITGNVACGLIGSDSFQEVDIVGITMPITKHNFIVKDITELADTLRTAFKIAKSGRQGPVLVDIPKDVQEAMCEYESNAQPVIPYPLTFASEDKLQKAAALINSCEKPYIYFGGGVISGKASQQILALAEKTDAPLGCSLMGLSAVPCDHPRFLGMQGMHGHFASNAALSEADLVIALGVRFSNRAAGDDSQFSKHSAIIHIDIDGAELHKNIPTDVAIKGDLHDSLERLIAMAEEKKHPQWTERIKQLREEEKLHTASALSIAKAKSGGKKLSPYDIVDIISARAGDDAVIVTDVGQHQMWTAQRYPLKKPRTFISSGGLGTMGFGLGAAVGAACATGRRCILFTGDGSFGMDLCELATAVSQQLPITVVIMNNGVLGMVRQWQTLFFDKRYSNTTLNRKTDFARLAEAFGAKGGHASSAAELEKLADEALLCNTPFVIDCAVDSDEYVLPMLPQGGSINDMITEIK
ncbi:biosynthetic-type acetolactate synthase large subunit, partial [Ruminococcus sp.]